MSDQNDSNKPGDQQQGGQQPGGDWGNNDGWGEQNPQPTGEPSVQETPGPQGPQQPSGGEWSGGHANNPNPPTSTANQSNQGWGEGQAQPNAQQHGGQMQQQPPNQPPQAGNDLSNNDIIAIVLSFFFPGVGHMMLGQTTKGIVMLGVFFFTCGGLGLLPFASIFDAFLLAKTVKYRAVDDWEFFPDMNQHL